MYSSYGITVVSLTLPLGIVQDSARIKTFLTHTV